MLLALCAPSLHRHRHGPEPAAEPSAGVVSWTPENLVRRPAYEPKRGDLLLTMLLPLATMILISAVIYLMLRWQ
jgi:hypothetical protein